MQRKYDPEVYSVRGNDIFNRRIAALAVDRNARDFVAIDIDSEDFEIDAVSMKAAERLKARRPQAQVFFRRIGSTIAFRFGFRSHAQMKPVAEERP